MSKNMVLILGSSEGLQYAKELQSLLLERFRTMSMECDCVLWNSSTVWLNGSATLDSLIEKAKELKKAKGFAITLFTPDDIVDMRKDSQYCSRDNVWLEYGLFAGIIGKKYVFAVCPENPVVKEGLAKDWRRPSDFNLYELQYHYEDTVGKSSIEKVAIGIADRIHRLSSEKNKTNPKDIQPPLSDGFSRSY